MTGGVVIAAPASGSGKTVITLALLRAFRAAGIKVGSLKIGPDYIDPGFHRVASGAECRNYDPWAMRTATLECQRDCVAGQVDFIVAEGVTGLFDGAADGTGSTADAANQLGWPILLVVDVKGQGASAAALVEGFAHHRKDTRIAGVIFNRVGSERHRAMLAGATGSTGIPIIGMLPRDAAFDFPDRHLGLVQAAELSGLDRQIDSAAALLAAEIDLTALADLAGPLTAGTVNPTAPPVPSPGQRVAVASDDAFSFAYPHILDGWRDAGTEISAFSPLADQAPDPTADAVYLPGGYPELHAGRLAGSRHFIDGIRAAAARGATIFGECGGYMVLGQGLIDREGSCFEMAGLLPVETSFAVPRLHLGYRRLTLGADCFLGMRGDDYRGHEFHYSSQNSSQSGAPPVSALFTAVDATGAALPPAGCRQGNVMGAYVHLIDRAR